MNGIINSLDPMNIAVAILAGLIGTWAYFQMQPPRPDPFTGREAREMELRLTHIIERYDARLEAHLQYSLRKTEGYDKQLAVLSVRCKQAFEDR